jgi:fatty acid desaturase
MHPLLHLLMTQPGLLGEHAQGYAGLLASEVAELQQVGQRRLLWSAATVACTSIGLVLAGVALMLWAVMPTLTVGALWVLLLTSCVPLAAALACLQVLRKPTPAAFNRFKQQIQADMQLLCEFQAR